MILPELYKRFKNGPATAEFLLRSAGFNIAAPTYYDKGIIAGFKF